MAVLSCKFPLRNFPARLKTDNICNGRDGEREREKERERERKKMLATIEIIIYSRQFQ